MIFRACAEMNDMKFAATRPGYGPGEMEAYMAFFTSAVTTLQTLVVALGAGLAVWGVVNLLEGYGSDNAAAKSQGIKQLMAGGSVSQKIIYGILKIIPGGAGQAVTCSTSGMGFRLK